MPFENKILLACIIYDISLILHFVLFGCLETRIVKKGNALNFQNSFFPILTYGRESWIMTERVRSQRQASELRFLRRIEGVTLFDKVRSSEIRKSLNIEPLLLRM